MRLSLNDIPALPAKPRIYVDSVELPNWLECDTDESWCEYMVEPAGGEPKDFYAGHISRGVVVGAVSVQWEAKS